MSSKESARAELVKEVNEAIEALLDQVKSDAIEKVASSHGMDPDELEDMYDDFTELAKDEEQ